METPLRIRIPFEDYSEQIRFLKNGQNDILVPDDLFKLYRRKDACEFIIRNYHKTDYKYCKPVEYYEEELKKTDEEVEYQSDLRKYLFLVPFELWPYTCRMRAIRHTLVMDTP
jgi:hypothetical protein